MKPFLLLLILSFYSCNNARVKSETFETVITNVSIIDIYTGEVRQNMHVAIDSNQITSIFSSSDSPFEASNTIDGNDKYLIPGLAEMHAHIPPPSTSQERLNDVLFLYLSNGITTIRGMLGDPMHLELREKAKNPVFLSPRIFTSSPSLNGNSVKTAEEAQQKVRAYKEDGYDFLKIHPGIKLEVFNALVETAKKVDIEIAGHVPVDVGIRNALNSNYASIDHIDGFLEGLVSDSLNLNPADNGFFGYNFTPYADQSKIEELVTLSKEKEVWIVPTQSLFERWFAPITAKELLAQPEMKYMPQSTLENWKRVKENAMNDENFNKEQWQKFDSIRMNLLKQLSDNGYGILLGSDAPQLFNVPGFSIHHEIDGMQRAGMSNLEILQSGTINPAKFFDMENDFGQVKEGMIADLILLNANPLDDLDGLKEIEGVMFRGHWMPKSEIDNKLAEISKKLNQE